MASIEKIKTKKGIAHRITYRFQNKTFKEYFPANIDKEIVLARKKEIEFGISYHRLNIKHFNPKEKSKQKPLKLKDFGSWYASQRQIDEKPIKKSTLTRYLLSLKLFANAIGPDFLVSKITTNTIIQFKKHEKSKGKTERGINIDLRHLSHPLKLAKQQGIIKQEIIIEKYKTTKKLPPVLMPHEVIELESKITNPEILLAFQILKWTGIRRSELVLRCKKQHFNLKQNYLIIIGKNGEERTAPIHPELKNFLQKNSIFKSRKPEENIIKIHPDTLTHALQRALKKIGKSNGSSVHILRHSFGLFLINSGKFNLREVQELLGHKSPYMTSLYTQIIKKNIKEKFNQISYQ